MKRFLLLGTAVLLTLWACHKDEGEYTAGGGPTPYVLAIPRGLPPMPIPADNPLTVEGVALGKRLFYDPILSGDNTQSCASCHRQSFAFTDSTLQFSIGIDQRAGNRNAMPLFNIGYARNFFWDGGAANLETQVLGPITNPLEMHEELANCIAELRADPEYPNLFLKAFGTDSITTALLMKAIAQFERTILSGNSKYDAVQRGTATFTAAEQRGRDIFTDFQKGDCTHCHTLGSTFTDFEYRNTGLDSIAVDSGRARITLLPADLGRFKTPSLRNVELTGPYMHDGRFTTLQQVMDHYNTGFHYPPNLDPNLRSAVKGRMTQQDMDDLIAFMKTLTDYDLISDPRFQPE
jgi:cytochrome c peroxidase